MITRSSTMASSMLRLNDIGLAEARMNETARQLTSGRVINKMSDNPADATASLAQRADLRRVEQLQRNVDDASSWLTQADSALISTDDALRSAKALLVQAQNGANSPSALAGIAGELRSIREGLITTANTSHLGRPIFGGTSGSDIAYDATGAYVGDDGSVYRTIESAAGSQAMVVNRTGPQVFGEFDALDPMAGDVFQLLDHLATAVTAGDNATIGTGIDAMTSAADRVGIATVELGSRLNLLESTSDRLLATKENLLAGISTLEDTDLAEASVQFKQREIAYQAALQATAAVSSLSLMDFLR